MKPAGLSYSEMTAEAIRKRSDGRRRRIRSLYAWLSRPQRSALTLNGPLTSTIPTGLKLGSSPTSSAWPMMSCGGEGRGRGSKY